MVERQVVDLKVAGSIPVSHPRVKLGSPCLGLLHFIIDKYSSVSKNMSMPNMPQKSPSFENINTPTAQTTSKLDTKSTMLVTTSSIPKVGIVLLLIAMVFKFIVVDLIGINSTIMLLFVITLLPFIYVAIPISALISVLMLVICVSRHQKEMIKAYVLNIIFSAIFYLIFFLSWNFFIK